MLKTLVIAATFGLSLSSAALAQEPANPGAQQTAPTIQTLNMIDRSELPPEAQAQVDAVVASRSEADMEQLRSTLGTQPQITALLDSRGASMEDVILAQLSPEGVLTLVTALETETETD